MAIFVDLLPIIILLAFTVIFAARGFIKSLLVFSKTLISFICAYLFGPAAAAFFSNLFVNKMVTDKVYNKLLDAFSGGENGVFDLSLVFEWINTKLLWIKNFGANVDELSQTYGEMTSAGSDKLYELASKISAPIVNIISNLMGYIFVFLVAFALCFVLTLLVNGISALLDKIPVIGKINHILGGILGLVFGAVISVSLVYIVDAVMHFSGALNEAFDYNAFIENSKVFRFIRDLNIIQYLKTR